MPLDQPLTLPALILDEQQRLDVLTDVLALFERKDVPSALVEALTAAFGETFAYPALMSATAQIEQRAGLTDA